LIGNKGKVKRYLIIGAKLQVSLTCMYCLDIPLLWGYVIYLRVENTY